MLAFKSHTSNNKKSEAKASLCNIFGWKMGLEPTTPGTTIQCSNRLSYIHHLSPRFSRTVCKGKNYFSFHQNFPKNFSLKPYFTCNRMYPSVGIIAFTALL